MYSTSQEFALKAMEIDSTSSHAIIILGSSYFDSGNFQKAFLVFFQAMRHKPTKEWMIYLLHVIDHTNDIFLLKEFLRQIEQETPSSLWIVLHGVCLEMCGRYQEAIEVFHPVLDVEECIVSCRIGCCMYAQCHFESALDWFLRSATIRVSYLALVMLSLSLYRLERYADAIHTVKRIQQSKGTFTHRVHRLFAAACFLLGFQDDAIQMYEYLYAQNTSDIHTMISMGVIYIAVARVDDALFVFQNGLKKDPHNKIIHSYIRQCHVKRNEHTIAANMYIDPSTDADDFLFVLETPTVKLHTID